MPKMVTLLGIILAGLAGSIAPAQTAVSPPADALVERLDLDIKFYAKHLDAGGIPIVASEKVSDYALLEARWILDRMLEGRDDLRRAIAATKVRLAIMAPDEHTTAIPEHSDLKPPAYWDKRARGLGATDLRPAVSVGEENLLGYKGDPYAEENILVHEFAHVLHQHGLTHVEEGFDERLRGIFDAAVEEGLWKGKYAGTNHSEYFAEAVQSWFGTNREDDHDHNHVNTRRELLEYDPRLGALMMEIFGENEWRYLRPPDRPKPPAHLVGYDPSRAAFFVWPEEVVEAYEAHQAGRHLELLEDLFEEDWSEARSSKSFRRVQVRFENKTAGAIRIQWVDFEGDRQVMGRADPGRNAEQSTFAGHLWEVLDEQDTVIARFRAGRKNARGVVSDDIEAK